MDDYQQDRYGWRISRIRGVSNFRELGGYVAVDGRRVRPGLLYRSGHLARIKSSGLRQLERVELHSIIDFRSEFEKKRQSNRMPQHSRYIELPVLEELNREFYRDFLERLKSNKIEGFKADEKMHRIYREFGMSCDEQYKKFFQSVLAAEGAPVLWHCTAGKDRTGFAAAILLKILGVEDETIFADYLLTNQYPSYLRRRILLLGLARGRKAYRLMKPMVGVERGWLEVAFTAVNERWGSFENYIKHGLALRDADIQQLQDTLLE